LNLSVYNVCAQLAGKEREGVIVRPRERETEKARAPERDRGKAGGSERTRQSKRYTHIQTCALERNRHKSRA